MFLFITPSHNKNIFRLFQYFLSVLPWLVTWSASCSFLFIGYFSQPALMYGSSTSGIQVLAFFKHLISSIFSLICLYILWGNNWLCFRILKNFLYNFIPPVRVHIIIPISFWRNEPTFTLKLCQLFPIFRKRNMSAHRGSLAFICVHWGRSQTQGV